MHTHKNTLFLVVIALMVLGFLFIAMSKPSSEASVKNAFTSVDSASPMAKGAENAEVEIIQYSDFLCPSCSLFSTQIMPQITLDYIDTDQAKFEFRPMAFIAEGSTIAGAGAYCAVEQNKFWEYHDSVYIFVGNKIFNEGKDPTRDTILTAPIVKTIATEAGLETMSFATCVDSGRHTNSISKSTELANSNGVSGTPYVMINGTQYRGSMTYDSVNALIKAQL